MAITGEILNESKFRGYSDETKSWHYGHGWYRDDYTEEYLKKNNMKQQAVLYTDGHPVQCRLSTIGEFTGLKDKHGKELYSGQIIKIPCNTNKTLHGDYSLHVIMKSHGTFITSYITSEKGNVLPEAYVRGFLMDLYEYTPKLLLWSDTYEPATNIELVD